jgi:hypothetical protein
MYETYALRLDHYMVTESGERCMLEEPLVVKMVIDKTAMPAPVCLNRMLDMMRNEVLKRAGDD